MWLTRALFCNARTRTALRKNPLNFSSCFPSPLPLPIPPYEQHQDITTTPYSPPQLLRPLRDTLGRLPPCHWRSNRDSGGGEVERGRRTRASSPRCCGLATRKEAHADVRRPTKLEWLPLRKKQRRATVNSVGRDQNPTLHVETGATFCRFPLCGTGPDALVIFSTVFPSSDSHASK